MKVLLPSSTHWSPSRRAVVRMPESASLPAPGSVSPQDPIFSLRSTGHAQSRTCSGVPLFATLAPKSPVLAPQLSANDGLTRAISTAKVVRA